MSTTSTAQWVVLTTNIETHVGLQFAVNIKEAVALNSIDYKYRNIALNDIAKGEDVDTRRAFDSFYEVDGERLVTIGKYGATSNKVQCYTGKNKLVDGATLYYSQRGALMVKDSERELNTTTSPAAPVKTDIFANHKR